MPNPAIEQLLRQRAGLDPESVGRRIIARAVAAGKQRTGSSDDRDYLAALARSPAEWAALIDAVVVPETSFFRDREPFAFLRNQVLDAWLPAHPGQTLRVLSAACSTGEEPYSIAITLLEAGVAPEQFHIDAADISAAAVRQARRAQYRQQAFRGQPPASLDRYVERGSGGWVLKPIVTRQVDFHVDNLVDPAFLAGQAPYPVVFCRNVVIYLAEEARSRVLQNLERLLAPAGILFAGHSELAFFQRAGYAPLAHARSFACIRAGDPGRRRTQSARPASGAAPLPAKAPPPPAAVPALECIDPSAPEGGLAAARRLADRGELARARLLCERLLKDQPPRADAYCLLGLVHQASGRLAEAETCYAKALYLDPRCLEALVHLGLCHERRGDGAGAAVMRDRARRIEAAVQ